MITYYETECTYLIFFKSPKRKNVQDTIETPVILIILIIIIPFSFLFFGTDNLDFHSIWHAVFSEIRNIKGLISLRNSHTN